MKVLQIIQRLQLRGAEVFACQLSNNLVGLGHQVKMVALMDGPAKMPFDGEIEVVGVKLGTRLADRQGWKKLNDIITYFQPDLVQANAGDTLKYAAFSKMMYGWKAKLVFRNANKMGDFITSKWKWYFNKWLLRQVDYVASVSDECRMDFIKTFHWNPENISTLPIGVDQPVETSYNPLREKDWINISPVFLSVASFVPEKNHAGLIRIFQLLLRSFPSARLIMIGEGKLKDQIKQHCEALGIEDKVWLTGRRSDVASFMQHTHALFMPSLIEGLPGVILEAFANKLPVVAYAVGGIPEVVVNADTGMLVSKNDEQAFVNAVVEIMGHANGLTASIKSNAYALTQSAYNNVVIAERFLDAYENLVPQKNKAAFS